MTQEATTTWQVWDCGDLIGTFPTWQAAMACRAGRLDLARRDWPQLAGLSAQTVCVIPTGPPADHGPSAGPR